MKKKAFVLLDLLDHLLLLFFLGGGVTNIFTFCVNCGNFCFLFLFICGYIPNSILLMNYASAKRELKIFSTRAFVLIGLLKHFLLFFRGGGVTNFKSFFVNCRISTFLSVCFYLPVATLQIQYCWWIMRAWSTSRKFLVHINLKKKNTFVSTYW